MVRNPPCNAGDAGSILGWGTKIPHTAELVSSSTTNYWSPHLCATTSKSVCLNKRSHMPQLRPNSAKEINQFSSVTQSCPTLWDPLDCTCQASLSTTNSQSLLRLMSIESVIPSFVIPFSCLQSFLASGSFPLSQFFASGGQSIGTSASVSVFPRNIQDWFPLWLTGIKSHHLEMIKSQLIQKLNWL